MIFFTYPNDFGIKEKSIILTHTIAVAKIPALLMNGFVVQANLKKFK